MTRRINSLLPASLGTAIILAVILAVGRPMVFTDTRDYMIHGARFYQTLRKVFLNEDPARPPATPEGDKEYDRQVWAKHFNHSNMAARSPYYGVFLYTLAHRGTLWTLTIVQALCCAWLAFLLWRSMASPQAPGWTYYAMMAALAAGTSLPWVAGFAVPDIFAAVLAMAVTLIFLHRDQLRRWEFWGVWGLILASVVFHSSHLLIALGLIATGLLIGWMAKAPWRTQKHSAGMVLGACAAAMVLSWIYSTAIQQTTGDEFRRPPFLIARVLADGPGRAYLRYSCAKGADWEICRFKDLPLNKSDDILWSSKKELGVFNRSNYDQRVRMEKQEFSFVLHTIEYDPWGQFSASMGNWNAQFMRFWVDDPLRKPGAFLKHKYWGATNLVGLMRGVGPCGKLGELCEPKITITQLAAVDEKVLIGALILFAIAACQKLGYRRVWTGLEWSRPSDRAVAATLMIAAAIVINAAVCGIFSGPFPRYQARVIWLFPLDALLLCIAVMPAAAWAWLRARTALRMPEPWVRGWRDAGQAVVARVDPAFLRFGVVGAAGFAVDAAVLHALVDGAGLDPFSARLISFPVAVFVTWTLNRAWTFRSARGAGRLRQAAVYVGVQFAGGLANYSVYTVALVAAPMLRHWLLIPLALGSAAGLCLTFLGSKHLAFRTTENVASAAAPDPTSAV